MRCRQLIVYAVAAGWFAMLSSCAGQKDPPETTVSWLAPQTRAAKPSDCPMPILNALPNIDYQQIAIVNVADDYNATEQEVVDLARRKGCETGADALVILENQRQERGKTFDEGSKQSQQQEETPEIGEAGHKGRFVDAVAIVYKNGSATSNSADSAR